MEYKYWLVAAMFYDENQRPSTDLRNEFMSNGEWRRYDKEGVIIDEIKKNIFKEGDFFALKRLRKSENKIEISAIGVVKKILSNNVKVDWFFIADKEIDFSKVPSQYQESNTIFDITNEKNFIKQIFYLW